MIEVTSWGIGASVVDAGRPGRAWLGASRGGAVDLGSLHLANRLLGNPADAPAIETSGGTTLRITRPTMIAICGAVADVRVVDGPPLGWGAPVVLPAGATVSVGRLVDGARVYLGVRGGIAVDGSVLHVGEDPGVPAATQAAPRGPAVTTIRVWPGPRLDWFTSGAWRDLLTGVFEVTVTSRVGTRLAGPALARTVIEELPSEGLVEGAIQVPPDGGPIVMLADHPTTGGYPVIAVVDPDDIGHAAQAAPGTKLRFATAAKSGAS